MFLATATTSGISLVLIYVVIFGAMWFFLIRPQRKQQKAMNELLSSIEIGDSVLTTSGFYGVILDVMDDTVIVEFGNNKNCRIPMKKEAIAAVEKPDLNKNSEE
jgi:preprotein translocase subunit YajC